MKVFGFHFEALKQHISTMKQRLVGELAVSCFEKPTLHVSKYSLLNLDFYSNCEVKVVDKDILDVARCYH